MISQMLQLLPPFEFGWDPATIYTLIALYAGFKVLSFSMGFLFKASRPEVVPGVRKEPWKAIGKSPFELDVSETKQLNLEMRESFFLNKSVNISKRREQLYALKK